MEFTHDQWDAPIQDLEFYGLAQKYIHAIELNTGAIRMGEFIELQLRPGDVDRWQGIDRFGVIEIQRALKDWYKGSRQNGEHRIQHL